MKPLLVGESNPYGKDPKFALYPLPERAAGWRLCKLVMDLEMTTYLRLFDRVNLCVGEWSQKAARTRAAELLSDRTERGQHDSYVLLGAKVCAAFGVPFEPFTTSVLPTGPAREVGVVVLPHPSGLNRLWNDPGAFYKAREALRSAGVLPADRGA